jgi:hypothetical protein
VKDEVVACDEQMVAHVRKDDRREIVQRGAVDRYRRQTRRAPISIR